MRSSALAVNAMINRRMPSSSGDRCRCSHFRGSGAQISPPALAWISMQGRFWIAAAGVVAALWFAVPAHAGTYRVWTCRGPDAKPAPIRDATSGWIPSGRGNTQFMTLDDRCAGAGGIYGHLGGNSQPTAAGGQWTFTPPPGATLGGFVLTWSGTVSGGAEATLSRSDQKDPTYVERNGGPFGAHTVSQGGFDITALSV